MFCFCWPITTDKVMLIMMMMMMMMLIIIIIIIIIIHRSQGNGWNRSVSRDLTL